MEAKSTFLMILQAPREQMRIVESLEQVVRLVPDVHSVLIVDRDGVAVAGAGEESRNRAQLSAAFASALEQAGRLSIGEQESWVFHYDSYQLVVLHAPPFAVFVVAAPQANTALLCQLHTRLAPTLEECRQIVEEAAS